MEDNVNTMTKRLVQQGPPEPQTKQKILIFILGMMFMLVLIYTAGSDALRLIGQQRYSIAEVDAAQDSLRYTIQMLEQKVITEQQYVIQGEEFAEIVSVTYFLKGYSKSPTVKKGDITAFVKSMKDDHYLMDNILKHNNNALSEEVVTAIKHELNKQINSSIDEQIDPEGAYGL